MKERKTTRCANGWRLLLVQSISCAILILTVLILRLVGGGIFRQLGEYFEEAMRQNALAAAIHALWGEEVTYSSSTTPAEAVTTVPPAATTATTTTATVETTAVPTVSTAATAAPAAPAAATAAAWPVAGATVTSGYGDRTDPFTGKPAFHSGIDLAAPEGTPVAALWAGEVIGADSVGAGSLGKYVTVTCENGLEIRCAHMSALSVQVGDRVAAGDRLGAVGHTGRATGPHLHLEIRQNGELRDPAPWLPSGYV